MRKDYSTTPLFGHLHSKHKIDLKNGCKKKNIPNKSNKSTTRHIRRQMRNLHLSTSENGPHLEHDERESDAASGNDGMINEAKPRELTAAANRDDSHYEDDHDNDDERTLHEIGKFFHHNLQTTIPWVVKTRTKVTFDPNRVIFFRSIQIGGVLCRFE